MRKMTKNVKVFLCMLVMAALFLGNFSFNSLAAEAESMADTMKEAVEPEILEAKVIKNMDWSSDIVLYTMLVDCIITVSGDTNGMLIEISTGTVGTSSVSGVKDIKIYKKNWLGRWDLVAASSGGEDYNCATMGVSVLYRNAVKGATYKITCVHYGNVNGYIEGDHDSGEFVFTY